MCCCHHTHVEKKKDDCSRTLVDFKMLKRSCCRITYQNGERRQPNIFATGKLDVRLKEASLSSIQKKQLKVSKNHIEMPSLQMCSILTQAKTPHLSELEKFETNPCCHCVNAIENNKKFMEPQPERGKELIVFDNPAFSGSHGWFQKTKTLAGHRQVSKGRIQLRKRKRRKRIRSGRGVQFNRGGGHCRHNYP